jgi:hypothetical protein
MVAAAYAARQRLMQTKSRLIGSQNADHRMITQITLASRAMVIGACVTNMLLFTQRKCGGEIRVLSTKGMPAEVEPRS